MNDSSSGNCVFQSNLSAKRGFFSIFGTQGDRDTSCDDVSAALWRIFGAETHHICSFFVAFLKFPPIVQSGSILFRKLELEGAGVTRAPLPLPSLIG